MFDGFTLDTVQLSEARLRVRHGGAGPPLLLLHGHPRTHTTWWRVAPLLADRHTVVCPDLRGFGRSSKPAAPHLRSDGGPRPRLLVQRLQLLHLALQQVAVGRTVGLL